MSKSDSFPRRHGLSPTAPPIKFRDAAPADLRSSAIFFAIDYGLSAGHIRSLLQDLLVVARAPDSWEEFGLDDQVAAKCVALLQDAPWFTVYEFIELLHSELAQSVANYRGAERFQETMNRYFENHGIGWKFVDGRIEARGSEPFEHVATMARATLAEAELTTAQTEVHEALLGLSRRPEPDVTGSVRHAAAAAECVARHVTGDTTATLGQILARRPDLLPSPLPAALEKLWGYSSEYARHVREGRTPTREEAELVVSLLCAIASFLARK